MLIFPIDPTNRATVDKFTAANNIGLTIIMADKNEGKKKNEPEFKLILLYASKTLYDRQLSQR